MIYFDTAYVAKCYLSEPDSAAVIELARKQQAVLISDWTRVELNAVFHRHRREGQLSKREAEVASEAFDQDLEARVWLAVPITPVLEALVDALKTAPSSLFIRSADALHLASAKHGEADAIWTNDRHMLAAAKHFGVKAKSVR